MTDGQPIPDIELWDIALRLGLAALLTGAVGLEREWRERSAGLRTHMLVGVGSALFTLVSAYAWTDFVFDRTQGTVFDPTRIAAQIVTGIGFIGAGAIIRSGFSVRGLTTAATLWVSAALGVAAGAGAYVPAIAATALGFVILVGLERAKPLLRALLGPQSTVLHLEYERGHGTLGPVLRELESEGCRVSMLRLDDEEGSADRNGRPGRRTATIEIRATDHRRLESLVDSFRKRGEVQVATLDRV
jgi:putative Mg2+ transporter-C (MgtC) family protein